MKSAYGTAENFGHGVAATFGNGLIPALPTPDWTDKRYARHYELPNAPCKVTGTRDYWAVPRSVVSTITAKKT